MRMFDLIDKKKHGEELSEQEISWFVNSMMDGTIGDEQVVALLMAICFVGMTDDETYHLTMAMRDSGDLLDLSDIDGVVVDKHSTGGVGDKTTLILCPIIAACGAPVAKMSGRGLGNTGGTIDKMESIPGFRTAIDKSTFIGNINKNKIALASQTGNLAPADKKLYALRDTTATVDQASLIASSIMSKKLASGAQAICCDVKVGNGAFMKNEEDAEHLARLMVAIGSKCNRTTKALLTRMDEPLGYAVGNTLEIIEVIEALKGNGPKDLMEVVFALGTEMLKLAGICDSDDKAIELMETAIADESALDKFKCLVASQGGDVSAIDDIHKLPVAKHIYEVKAKRGGYIHKVCADNIGHACMLLGGGRKRKEDDINPGVGVVLAVKVADEVKSGDVVARIYYDDDKELSRAKEEVVSAIGIEDEAIERLPVIIGMV